MSDLLRTLVTTKARPPLERPPLGDQGIYPLPGINERDDPRFNGREGRGEHRQYRDDRGFLPNPGWHHQDDRRAQFNDDHHDPHQGDRLMHTWPLRLEFPHFDGENPTR